MAHRIGNPKNGLLGLLEIEAEEPILLPIPRELLGKTHLLKERAAYKEVPRAHHIEDVFLAQPLVDALGVRSHTPLQANVELLGLRPQIYPAAYHIHPHVAPHGSHVVLQVLVAHRGHVAIQEQKPLAPRQVREPIPNAATPQIL